MSILVASYNVRCCIGIDGREDLSRVARVVRELDPDVLAVQEITSCQPGRPADQVTALAARVDMGAVVGATFRRLEGVYGNALLTKLPVVEYRSLNLSQSGREPRGALDVELSTPRGHLRVIATHLGLRPLERNRQVDTLLRTEPGTMGRPVVLLGDFNSWIPTSRVLRRLRRRFGGQPAWRSFPSTRPLLPLDRIWVEPVAVLRQAGVHDSSLAIEASDHLPVWACLEA